MTSRRTALKRAVVIAADSIAIAHFVVANICIILGEYTKIFSEVGTRHPGLQFVYEYFDSPLRALFDTLVTSSMNDPFYAFALGEIIIIFSSFLYGIIVYICLSFILAVFSR